MNSTHISVCVGLVAGTVLISLGPQAQAASFTSFGFTTQWSGNAPTGNIILNSVTTTGGDVFKDFFLVNSVTSLVNNQWTTGNTGAASVDHGDTATPAVVLPVRNDRENPSKDNVAAFLGNLNLNNIIDSEDNGSFTMDVVFNQASDRFFFWERGMNSRLKVQALDANNNVLATTTLNSNKDAVYTGFNIDTTEIDGAQRVGGMGLLLDGFVTNRLRLISESSFNGPDFKVVAAATSVPEPATVTGLAIAAGTMAVARRRKTVKSA